MNFVIENAILVACFLVVLILLVMAYFIARDKKPVLPISIEEAKLNLLQHLDRIGCNPSIEIDGRKIIVNFEYLPSSETISFVPVLYKGYIIESRLKGEESVYKIK